MEDTSVQTLLYQILAPSADTFADQPGEYIIFHCTLCKGQTSGISADGNHDLIQRPGLRACVLVWETRSSPFIWNQPDATCLPQ